MHESTGVHRSSAVRPVSASRQHSHIVVPHILSSHFSRKSCNARAHTSPFAAMTAHSYLRARRLLCAMTAIRINYCLHPFCPFVLVTAASLSFRPLACPPPSCPSQSTRSTSARLCLRIDQRGCEDRRARSKWQRGGETSVRGWDRFIDESGGDAAAVHGGMRHRGCSSRSLRPRRCIRVDRGERGGNEQATAPQSPLDCITGTQ